MTLLTQAQATQVAEAIREVELKTDAELVTVLAGQADDYHYIPTLWAAIAALLSPAVLLLTPYWLDLTDVLTLQLAVFIGLAVLLRLPPVLRHIIPRSVKHWRAGNLARRQFLECNLHHTLGETGLLIFVSETERYVEIVADRGISRHVDDSVWEQIVANFTQAVHRGETLKGFLDCIDACGQVCAAHIPPTGQRDELSNHLVIL